MLCFALLQQQRANLHGGCAGNSAASIGGEQSRGSAWIRQVYECVEFFCGTAWVSRCMKMAKVPTANLDIEMGSDDTPENKQNVFDILTPSGMAWPARTW